MGVAPKFLYLCVKLHPKLPVKKKQNQTKKKNLKHNISSFGAEFGKKTPSNQVCVSCLPLSLRVDLCTSATGTLDCKILPEQCWERKLCVKIQHWLYFYYVSKPNINTDVRDYLEQQSLWRPVQSMCFSLMLSLCSYTYRVFCSRETWMSWASF